MIGQVTKILSNAYRVTADGEDYKAIARGKLRLTGDIFVGDQVEFSTERGDAAIEKVLPRRNVLVRPYVSNIDVVLIVAAPVPETDFLLVDKIIMNAKAQGVEPILVYNKNDLGGTFKEVKAAYDVVLQCVSVSTTTKNGISDLIKLLQGKTVAFAGQSAVGKTSLLNVFLEGYEKGKGDEKVGEMSEKSGRGKNTTRHVEMFNLGQFRAVDTCGFNMLECEEDDERELPYYYEEYVALADKCRFRGCSHMAEPDCAIKAAVASGALDKDRYARYQLIYEELKKKRGEKYD